MEEKQKRETLSLLPGGLDLTGGNRIKNSGRKKKEKGKKGGRKGRGKISDHDKCLRNTYV